MSALLSTAVTKSSTGTIVSMEAEVSSIGITGGADAATVIFRDGGPVGPIRWSLGVAAGVSDGIAFGDYGLRFDTDVHITITGTTPDVHVAVRSPQASQTNPS